MSTPRTYEEALEEIAWLKRELGQMRDAERMNHLRNKWGLTGKEQLILDALITRNGATVSVQGIMDAMYNCAADEPECKIVNVYICKMRNKMGADMIGTTWGVGYFLTPKGLAACKEAVENPAPPRPSSVRVGRQEVMAA